MKVFAYTLCKNEEPRIDAWLEATRECDGRIVIDTGSTDASVSKMRSAGVQVLEQRWDPFRFDEPRNLAIAELVKQGASTDDWLISPDLDETFAPGWRTELERIHREHPEATLVTYPVQFRVPGRPDSPGADRGRKIHKICYRWRFPIHEILEFQGPGREHVVASDRIIQIHAQDQAKPREEHYFELARRHLEKEPENDWLLWFVLRGYFSFRNEPAKVIELATRYLNATRPYTNFRAIALTELATAILKTGGNPQEAMGNLFRACAEDPGQFRAWCLMGELAERFGDFPAALFGWHRAALTGDPETRTLAQSRLEALRAGFAGAPGGHAPRPWDTT